MEQQADLAWLLSGAALPLTLLPQRAGAAAANAGCIHQAQAPIGFSALLVDTQGLPGRTPQRAIWLRGKVATREAARFPGQGLDGRSIALYRGRGRGWLLQRRSKFGRAHRDRLKLIAQLQAHAPYPLADDLPCLLTASRMTTPAIGVLLHVFISQSRFKRTAMQVERHHIGSRERALGESRQEKLIDDARTRDPDPTRGGPGRMSRDDEADELSCFA